MTQGVGFINNYGERISVVRFHVLPAQIFHCNQIGTDYELVSLDLLVRVKQQLLFEFFKNMISSRVKVK